MRRIARMIGLLQRVTEARVTVAGEVIGEIGKGLCVLVGVTPDDSERTAERLAERLLAYRVFPDDNGRMNLSLSDIDGGLLLVPQFTLAADTRKGNRASFTGAADPADAERLFDHLARAAAARHEEVAAGRFGAYMHVALVNDGPVTFWIEGKAG